MEEKLIGTTCMNLPIAVFFLTVLPALQLLFGKLKCFGILPIGILPIQPTIAYVHVLPLGVGFSHLPAPMPTSPHAPGTLQTTTSACGSGGKRWKTGHSPKQNVQNAWQTLAQNKSVGSGEAYQYKCYLKLHPRDPWGAASVPLRLVPTMAGMLWSSQYITGTEPNPETTCAKCQEHTFKQPPLACKG